MRYFVLLPALQAALKGAVSLCKRHSRDAAPAAAQELWFTVLQRYVALLRRLRQLARQQGAGPGPQEQAQRLAAAQVLAYLSDSCLCAQPYVAQVACCKTQHTKQRC